MAAFRGAVDVGAHAIETDLHLSKDGVVVLSHDATLNRCFGKPRKVSECEWAYLSTLLTLREPKEAMTCLVDLLEYVAQPGQEQIWLLLDIKRDDAADELFTCLAAAIASVPATSRPWNKRIILGAWDAEWVRACFKHLPEFPVALTTPSPAYASAMLAVPDLHFSLLNYSFATRRGNQFLLKAKNHARMVFSWSDNAEEWMALSIRNEVNGVITDNPKRFIELCDEWKYEAVRERASRSTIWEISFWAGININVWVTETISNFMQGSARKQIQKALGI
ncbi:PLC-like phosphodiesterase [Xylariales sp. AK1849]|nr:PLC-like phosphodiesterase [Xylariales sp. AK1849]